MDVLSLNQRFVRELLKLYRELPAVWNIKCPEYRNKLAKAQAYDLLVEKCREYVPDSDREFVKNKINSLRTSFRKELRKVQASKLKANDIISEVYVPNLWYYNLLTFTAEQDDNHTSMPVGKNDTKHFLNDHESSSYGESDFFDFKSEPSSPQTTQILLEEHDPLSPVSEVSPTRKKPRLSSPVTSASRQSSTTTEDVFDAIGKNVAHKLRGMSQQQRIVAEKIISDVMYHGQMETLTVNSHLSLD